ncbi:MAG: hypothetical protein MPJ25_01680 [Pirellulales bacterium]|nr:hypothetical protein [Pirellulales bacterium]
MNKYEFTINEYQTQVRTSEPFVVEANSQEEANDKARKLWKQDDFNEPDTHDYDYIDTQSVELENVKGDVIGRIEVKKPQTIGYNDVIKYLADEVVSYLDSEGQEKITEEELFDPTGFGFGLYENVADELEERGKLTLAE